MVKINDLTEVTAFESDDFLIIEDDSGTKKITLLNSRARLTEFATLTAPDISLDNDFFYMWDGTDGDPKRITFRNVVFGNYQNAQESEDFTLSPTTHNLRPIQCVGTFTTKVITLDKNQGLGGCCFTLFNISSADLTVNPINGITLFVDGVSGTGIIRQNRAASINVNNTNTLAVFSGG